MTITEHWVRDLCWAVNSPSLLGASSVLSRPENAALAAWQLEPDDVDGEHLSRYLSTDLPKRTGRYFERLVLYWLQHVRGCQLVAHSLQVRDGKRTVGEIDLLFRDEDDSLTHWELAVKFYLQIDAGKTAAGDYVGPNARDTLERKTQRLVEHQLPLSRRYFPEVEVRQAFVKGRIFYRWQPPQEPPDQQASLQYQQASPVLAPGHLCGQWLRHRDVASAFAANPLHCRVRAKPYWLAERTEPAPGQPMLSPHDSIRFLEHHFGNHARPILLSGYGAGPSQRPEPVSLFVVPDHWPQATEPH